MLKSCISVIQKDEKKADKLVESAESAKLGFVRNIITVWTVTRSVFER
jgi:hypothetical protein